MSSGTELATSGRLFTGFVQAIKGRYWSGTVVTRPDQVALSVTSRTATLSCANRTTALSISGRTVTLGVTP